MMLFYKKYKKIFNVVFNIALFCVLIYFTDFNSLLHVLSSVNVAFLALAVVFNLLFLVISGSRWRQATQMVSGLEVGSLFNFVRVSFKKEFFASFTSNLAGDAYGVMAITGSTRSSLAKSLLITRYYDLLVVVIICLFPLVVFGYLNIVLAVPLIGCLLTMLLFFHKMLSFANTHLMKIRSEKLLVLLKTMATERFVLKDIIILTGATFVLWSCRAFAAYFSFRGLQTHISFAALLFVAYVPVIASIVAFVLPKSVSGDSTTVGLGLLVGVDYAILVGYVFIQRICSFIISGAGIAMGFIPDSDRMGKNR